MAAIDEERLQTLMEIVNKENPDLQPYAIDDKGSYRAKLLSEKSNYIFINTFGWS